MQTFKLKNLLKVTVSVWPCDKESIHGFFFKKISKLIKIYSSLNTDKLKGERVAEVEYKARLENTFSTECQRAGFQVNTKVYKLCMENKRML